jgi:NAD-dependent dihydropyrimidine dehydrogenase PreA subunit
LRNADFKDRISGIAECGSSIRNPQSEIRNGVLMALFIDVEVTPAAAKDPELVKKLVEVCPVNIFAAGSSDGIEIIDKHLDECTLCELCLNAAPPGTVRVKKKYGERAVLERHQ